MSNLRYRCLALALAVVAPALRGADFYVASNGSASGDGSKGQPWDLATALAHPHGVHPGDTIWVRGGTYVGHFKSLLRGAPDKPIIVRPHPGEWFVIDHPVGGLRPAAHIFACAEGVAFADGGWQDPNTVGQHTMHVVEGDICAAGPAHVSRPPAKPRCRARRPHGRPPAPGSPRRTSAPAPPAPRR